MPQMCCLKDVRSWHVSAVKLQHASDTAYAEISAYQTSNTDARLQHSYCPLQARVQIKFSSYWKRRSCRKLLAANCFGEPLPHQKQSQHKRGSDNEYQVLASNAD